MTHQIEDPLQRPYAIGVLLFACGLLVACESPQAAAEASEASTTSAALRDAPPAIVEKLTAGLAKSAYEHILASAGWLPLWDREACLTHAATPSGNACRNIPGLQGCDAGDGVCRLQFARTDSAQAIELRVAAKGVGSDGLELGVLQSAAAVPLSQATRPAVAACPSQDFQRFLEVFAARPDIRVGLSAPLLHFEQVVEDEESDESPRDVLIQARRYTGFMLGYRNGSFRLLDSAGQDRGGVDIVITPRGSDALMLRCLTTWRALPIHSASMETAGDLKAAHQLHSDGRSPSQGGTTCRTIASESSSRMEAGAVTGSFPMVRVGKRPSANSRSIIPTPCNQCATIVAGNRGVAKRMPTLQKKQRV